MVILLILAQSSFTIKQIFDGNIFSLLFSIILLVGTVIFFIFLNIKPLIGPEKFPDEEEELDSMMLAHWWNNYRHPLVASNIHDDGSVCKID